jgi:hypothetical protein
MITWNIVINCHLHPFSILTYSQFVDTHVIVLLCDEESFNQMLPLCKTDQCREEVTVCEDTLLDVRWRNWVLIERDWTSHEFTWPSPLRPECKGVSLWTENVIQTRIARGKMSINEIGLENSKLIHELFKRHYFNWFSLRISFQFHIIPLCFCQS